MAKDNTIYHCRCGQEHDGDYGFYDYMHHMCFHQDGFLELQEMPDKSSSGIMCILCGATFGLEKIKKIDIDEPMFGIHLRETIQAFKSLFKRRRTK